MIIIVIAIAFMAGVLAGGFGGYKIGAKAKAEIQKALDEAQAIVARIKK